MTGSKLFVDTNILLYSVEGQATPKRTVARRTLSEVERGGNGVISFQIAAEFVSNLVKKYNKTPSEAELAFDALASLQLVATDQTTIRFALQLMGHASLSYWDAAVVAAAVQGGCETLLTEDLNHGQIIAGVKIVNPFV